MSHLDDNAMTYCQHWRFAAGHAWRCLVAACRLIVHAFIPWVFTCKQGAHDEAASLAEQGEGDFSVFPMAYEPQWIPVTERLPDHTNTVIVGDKHGVWFANRENKLAGWWDTCGGGEMENVTHWMPLPEPPCCQE